MTRTKDKSNNHSKEDYKSRDFEIDPRTADYEAILKQKFPNKPLTEVAEDLHTLVTKKSPLDDLFLTQITLKELENHNPNIHKDFHALVNQLEDIYSQEEREKKELLGYRSEMREAKLNGIKSFFKKLGYSALTTGFLVGAGTGAFLANKGYQQINLDALANDKVITLTESLEQERLLVEQERQNIISFYNPGISDILEIPEITIPNRERILYNEIMISNMSSNQASRLRNQEVIYSNNLENVNVVMKKGGGHIINNNVRNESLILELKDVNSGDLLAIHTYSFNEVSFNLSEAFSGGVTPMTSIGFEGQNVVKVNHQTQSLERRVVNNTQQELVYKGSSSQDNLYRQNSENIFNRVLELYNLGPGRN